MKKFLAITVAVLILSPLPAMAGGFPDISVSSSSTINQSCSLTLPSQFNPVWGCYSPAVNQIFINGNLPSAISGYVIAKVIGEYYLLGVSSSTLEQAINPYPALEDYQSIQDLASNQFASWLFDQSSVSSAENVLFTSLVVSKS